MNLVDLVDDKGLQQDEWSLTAPRFGKEGQLQVVGWSGRYFTEKGYILKCSKCSEDEELFGEGYFRLTKTRVLSGVNPCGCAFNPKWTKEQFATLCSRKAEQIGHTFLGFIGEWKGQNTKTEMLCEKHGKWYSGTIHPLINKGVGCPKCGISTTAKSKIKPDEEMIKSFFASGDFHPDTKFWRSDRESTQGVKVFWHMSCPECGDMGESSSVNLQRGSKPCACNNQRQREAYINLVVDSDDNITAIKFGISRDSKHRAKQQNYKSAYSLKQHSTYSFDSVQSCKKAERECLQELECGVVLKRDMKDGYTETTWLYNLERIIKIYERNGGTRVE